MRKKSLLTLLISLFTVGLWAADVSIVENYGTNLVAGSSTKRTSFQGRYTEWWYRNARSGSSDKLNDGTNGFWLSRTSGTSCYLESTLEGGIKNVAFNLRQFGTGDNGFNFVLNINTKIGSAASVTQKSITWTGAKSYVNADQSYNQAVAIKANNVKLTIQNSSTQSDGTTAGGRIVVGPITITPYLLYTQKDVNVLLGQTGYIHELIDNTDEGSITYESGNTDVATVDGNGMITPVSAGDATITATWEGVSTSYTVHVINGVMETFSGVNQTSVNANVGNWTNADVCNWEVHYARRGSNDKMQDKQYSWLTLTSDVRGYLKTTNLEGGIKDVSFHYGQFGAEAETLLRWQVSAIGTTTTSDVIERDGDLGENRSYSRGAHYTHAFNCAENAQLEIKNMSVKDDESQPTSNARLMIGDIYITPYLLYTTKAATLDTRNGLTYTNAGLINNTSGNTVVYSIEPIAPTTGGATIDANNGQVTAANDEVEGDFTITATWGNVSTTYVLNIISRTATEASYPEPNILEIGLNGTINKELEYTAGYDGTIVYASSNEKVAKFEGGVLTIKGVGQTTISATLPQTDNYKAAEASYILRIIDNSASVQVEAFTNVDKGNAAAHAGQPWDGDVYDWKVSDCGGVRKNGDKFASDQEHEGIWMGTPDDNSNYSSLTVEGGAEGGIKHIWFFCEQPYNTGETGYTLKPVVYLNGATAANKVGEVEIVGTSGAGNIAANRTLFGASDVTKSNSVLIIRNESYLTDGGTRPGSNRGRILLDQIHITPYLLYTTKEAELDLRIATTYTNADLINNTESGSITYTLEDNDGEASIDAATGEVTGIKAGQVTVKATWNEGAYTTYTLNIIAITETEASYPNAEIHATMDEAIPANVLNVSDGYDGEISYASSVPAVADFENGVLTLKAPGQTKITATLPETSNYTAATASYMLTVSYSNYESFNPNGTTSTYAKPEENAQGDMCKWYVYIGGIQTPNYFSSNAITTRAQRTNESKQGYAKSAKLSGGISALAFNYSMMYADNNIDKWDIHVYVNDRLVGQLTNEEGGDLEGINGRTLNPMRTKVITGIDEPGQFVIRFENHSTIKDGVEYESGNMGRFAIDNVSWENFVGPIVLNESTDNSSVIVANSGSTQDVQITRSDLVGGVWNTLCLPFVVSKANDLNGAEVQEMTNASLSGDVLTVGFSAVTDDVLEAGKPYLVRPTSSLNISGLYSDKEITSEAQSVSFSIITMEGLFSPLAVTAGDKTTLFVGTPNAEGDNLFYPSTSGDMRGLRAYFKINDSSAAPKRARFVVNQTENATGIDNAERTNIESRKVLRDGQLIIIRGDKEYNAQGQIVK